MVAGVPAVLNILSVNGVSTGPGVPAVGVPLFLLSLVLLSALVAVVLSAVPALEFLLWLESLLWSPWCP